jgi:hypothetical protein
VEADGRKTIYRKIFTPPRAVEDGRWKMEDGTDLATVEGK